MHNVLHDQSSPPENCWNLFAWQLECVLLKHNSRINLLDNLTFTDAQGDIRELLHREKVRRLVHSIHTPPDLPTLTRPELERVCDRGGIHDQEELLLLRAALLATSIQATLKDRIDLAHAALAAHQIFPTLVEALRTYDSEDDGLGAFTRGKGGSDMPPVSTGDPADEAQRRLDAALAPALELLDRATLSLSMSYYAASRFEKIERTRAAQEGFDAVLERLRSVPPDVRNTVAWHAWRDEAERGFDAAAERLDDLKAE